MPISPGSEWGASASIPQNAHVISSDRQLGVHLRDSSAKDVHGKSLLVTGGDITHVLGVKNRSLDTGCVRVVIDAIAVSYTDIHGSQHTDVCVGSLSISRRFQRGTISVVTNSGLWRGYEVAPRAHLNDGKLDIFEVSGAMRWSQRRLMWRKTATGTHLPHPLLSYSQGDFFNWEGNPLRLEIDGQFVASVTMVTCRVQSDCVQVYA